MRLPAGATAVRLATPSAARLPIGIAVEAFRKEYGSKSMPLIPSSPSPWLLDELAGNVNGKAGVGEGSGG